jgi:DNA invertase Pin-like site-specific DNA recombinase
MCAALAEFERDLIRERTSAGLAAARVRGHHGGRLSVLTGHKLISAIHSHRCQQRPRFSTTEATLYAAGGPREITL